MGPITKRRGRHLQCGHPAVTACSFTAGYPLRMREQ
ncbi:unnamed protein product, partial [Staurois parvus]